MTCSRVNFAVTLPVLLNVGTETGGQVQIVKNHREYVEKILLPYGLQ
jgi:hypothetical protein